MEHVNLARRAGRTFVVVVLAITALIVPSSPGGLAAATAASKGGPRPTIVLVHGDWADASSWNGVIERLQRRGYTVVAPPNPLRGPITNDAPHLASYLQTITGPIVLVAHSYGGFVITNAATGNTNVKALVYIAAFALDQGESLASISAQFPDSDLGASILPRPYPGGTDLYIRPDLFRSAFAADLPRATTDVMAATQRPLGDLAFGEPSGPPAWATIPSWYLVAGADNAVGTANERFMARRMHATTVVAKGASHIVMLSQPHKVTRLILDAATRRR